MTGQKTRADPSTRSAQRQCGGQPAPICNATRSNDRSVANNINDDSHKGHCRHGAAHVTARLPSLCHDNINAVVDRFAGLVRVTDRMHHNGTRVFGLADQMSGVIPKKRNYGHTHVKTGIQTFLLRELHVQIYGKWL